MWQKTTNLKIKTKKQGLYEFTAPVQAWLHETGVDTGLVTIFCRHTSASLMIQENADADVVLDLNDFFCALVPEDPHRYRHRNEGMDDMPAHIKSALSPVSLSIPVQGGRAVLGAWQGIYLFEHRAHGHDREVVLHILGQ